MEITVDSVVGHMFEFFILLATPVVGWFFKQIINDLRTLELAFHSYKEQSPHIFVLKSDYKEDMKEVKSKLNQILDKMDGKQDKIIKD